MKIILFLFILFLGNNSLVAQTKIEWKNPSFEDKPAAGRSPIHWWNCGAANESPPDIQPGAFDAWWPSFQGKTYLGLVVRDNKTNEGVFQELKNPILRDTTYQFSVMAFCSDVLNSKSSISGKNANYNEPTYLYVWGTNNPCQKTELLYSSPKPIANRDWEKQIITFTPKKTYRFIIIEAFFAPKGEKFKPFNGNLMLDALTPITVVKK